MSPEQYLLALVFGIFSVIIVQQSGDENQRAPIPRVERLTSDQFNQSDTLSAAQSESYDECIDHHSLCSYWSDMGFCQKNHTEMLRECPLSCDSCDDLDWGPNKPGCPSKYPNCQKCIDKSKMCPQWIKAGECKKHPGYMVLNCAKSCKYCHLQSDYELRCPMNEEYMKRVRSLKNPGDLNAMFERIVHLYNAHKNETEDDGVIPWDLEILSSDPWILRFDNFFTEEEAQGIIDAAGTFERSTDVGKKDDTGHFAKVTSTSRTSKNAWCHERCWGAPMVQQVMQRVEDLVGIPLDNSEHLQILEYEIGQFYRTHHDYIPNQNQMSCGPRILTWFMYLSDVDEGGATNFPRLGIKNEPKLGRVVFWPSVLDEDPTLIDTRTYHEAQPVIKGRKYGANSWFHLYDFQTPNRWTCTG